eukprot:gnl/Chilomastix_cuspidata/3299.p1 GENE.gnl/Chilomastix_cuspidata/3299~~gnl/Chilomastix_cuspidata/3299.p1  ORF type:complete len:323 (+),score=75.74 gnl/Chilomastix_cuspidata/3299:128-1096(+)
MSDRHVHTLEPERAACNDQCFSPFEVEGLDTTPISIRDAFEKLTGEKLVLKKFVLSSQQTEDASSKSKETSSASRQYKIAQLKNACADLTRQTEELVQKAVRCPALWEAHLLSLLPNAAAPTEPLAAPLADVTTALEASFAARDAKLLRRFSAPCEQPTREQLDTLERLEARAAQLEARLGPVRPGASLDRQLATLERRAEVLQKVCGGHSLRLQKSWEKIKMAQGTLPRPASELPAVPESAALADHVLMRLESLISVHAEEGAARASVEALQQKLQNDAYVHKLLGDALEQTVRQLESDAQNFSHAMSSLRTGALKVRWHL